MSVIHSIHTVIFQDSGSEYGMDDDDALSDWNLSKSFKYSYLCELVYLQIDENQQCPSTIFYCNVNYFTHDSFTYKAVTFL